jgi:predicted ATPase
VAWLIEETEQNTVYTIWEDVHWADPSTLEVLTLLLDQVPTTRLLAVLTFRPEFTPPWGQRTYLSQMTLSRLGRPEVETMVERVAGGKAFSSEVRQQIVAKTDGVPLFIEELTKSVVESVGTTHASSRQLAIPATLHDSLMARLDRLGAAKGIAQVGATIGREFDYALLQAVSALNEETLQQGLKQLVTAELVYQRGLVPQATYLFKHALIQDTAYQSLLKNTRPQLHRQIAHVLEEHFPDTKETQPELLAHHYTEAGFSAQAIPYWQQAGERASQRSAYVEAISHLTRGLEVLKALPDTPEHTRQELLLQATLGSTLMATKGIGASEVEQAYARARELCQQVGDTPWLFPVLRGLAAFYSVRPDFKAALELGEQCLRLAQGQQDAYPILGAHLEVGGALFGLGEFTQALEHFEEGNALYEPEKHCALAALYGYDLGVSCLCRTFYVLWYLGYPDQALKKSEQAFALVQEPFHPQSRAYTLMFAAVLHQLRREGQVVQKLTETVIKLSTEHELPLWLASGTILQGWVLAQQGEVEVGIAQLLEGLAAWRATGAELELPYFLSQLVEAYGKAGRVREGLSTVNEAIALVQKNRERIHEAELYRLKGKLLLQSRVPEEAEECFRQAIDIARCQRAKSLELRAATSLARLWQQQGKKAEAHKLLSEPYHWFTEGFDTKDLQDAKALLDELS